jgi:GNAT superfamily N-acetyltransferase
MALSIRIAGLADAADIARLTSQLGYEAEPVLVAERLGRILLQPDDRFWVADADGLVAGWLHALVNEFVESEAFVVIGGLVVDGAHRRRGIGRLLLQTAEDWARARGCAFVRLTSSATRASAHRFYQDVGYVNIKTQYSFAKPLNEHARHALGTFVPRVED